MSTTANYTELLKQLLPVGHAWRADKGTVLHDFLMVIAAELSFAHSRIDVLATEANAKTTGEMLRDWERELALPGPCMAGNYQTFQERRNAVVTKLIARGGQSVAYFKELAAALRYDAEIVEYRPFITGKSKTGHRIQTLSSRFMWKVKLADLNNLYQFRAGASVAGDRLGAFNQGVLECVFHDLKPAHTALFFDYSS